MHRNSRGGAVRLDRRGRRIGHNWWREHICDLLLHAELSWQSRRESGQAIHTGSTHVPGTDHDTAYYQLSEREYRMIHPRPTLKAFLLAHAGVHAEPESTP